MNLSLSEWVAWAADLSSATAVVSVVLLVLAAGGLIQAGRVWWRQRRAAASLRRLRENWRELQQREAGEGGSRARTELEEPVRLYHARIGGPGPVEDLVAGVLEIWFRRSAYRHEAHLLAFEDRLEGWLRPLRWLSGSLIVLGLFGTVLGLSLSVGSLESALGTFEEDAWSSLEAMMRGTLGGLSTAFVTSLLGLAGSVVISVFHYRLRGGCGRLLRNADALLLHEVEPLLFAGTEALLERTAETLERNHVSFLQRLEAAEAALDRRHETFLQSLAAASREMTGSYERIFSELRQTLTSLAGMLTEKVLDSQQAFERLSDVALHFQQGTARLDEGYRYLRESFQDVKSTYESHEADRQRLLTRLDRTGEIVAELLELQQAQTSKISAMVEGQERAIASMSRLTTFATDERDVSMRALEKFLESRFELSRAEHERFLAELTGRTAEQREELLRRLGERLRHEGEAFQAAAGAMGQAAERMDGAQEKALRHWAEAPGAIERQAAELFDRLVESLAAVIDERFQRAAALARRGEPPPLSGGIGAVRGGAAPESRNDRRAADQAPAGRKDAEA